MTGDTRQQRRKVQRDRLQAGAKVVRTGLPAVPPSPAVLAVASVVKAKLEERGNHRRAGEAARLAHDLAQASLKGYPPRVEIACRRGCSYCCHTYVEVRAPEVFLIASTVRASRRPELARQAVIARGLPLKGLGVGDRLGRKLACPLLIDNECSVYSARPLVCRQATSLSLTACIDEFDTPGTGGRIEISSAHIVHASNANVILMAALKAMNLPTSSYELSAALEIALGDPDGEEKWLSGEDVFAALPKHTGGDPQVALTAARIALDLNA